MLAALPSRSVFMFSAESGSAFSTLQVLAALLSHFVFSKFSLFLFIVSFPVSCPCIVDQPLSHRFGLCVYLVLDFCSGYRTTPLLKPSGYRSPIKDPRLPWDYSVSCPCHTCLLFIEPCPFMTTPLNKA